MAKKAMLGISRSPCLLRTGCTQQFGCASNPYAVIHGYRRRGVGLQVTRQASAEELSLLCTLNTWFQS